MRKPVSTAAGVVLLAGSIVLPAAQAQEWGNQETATPGSNRGVRELPNRGQSGGRNAMPIAVNSSYGVTGDSLAGSAPTSAQGAARASSQPVDASGRRDRRRQLANRQAGLPDTPGNRNQPVTIETDAHSSLVGQQVQKGSYNNVVDGLMYGDNLLLDQVAISEDYVAACDGYYGYGGGVPAVVGGIAVTPPDGLPRLAVDDQANATGAGEASEDD